MVTYSQQDVRLNWKIKSRSEFVFTVTCNQTAVEPEGVSQEGVESFLFGGGGYA